MDNKYRCREDIITFTYDEDMFPCKHKINRGESISIVAFDSNLIEVKDEHNNICNMGYLVFRDFFEKNEGIEMSAEYRCREDITILGTHDINLNKGKLVSIVSFIYNDIILKDIKGIYFSMGYSVFKDYFEKVEE